MTEDHMTLAYFLALSDVESDKLCEESTFAAMFVGRSFTWLEREQIGSEAGAIRGNESWDWIVPGTTVEFYVDNLYGRQVGTVESIEVERYPDGTLPFALIRKPNGRRIFRVEFGRIRKPRN